MAGRATVARLSNGGREVMGGRWSGRPTNKALAEAVAEVEAMQVDDLLKLTPLNYSYGSIGARLSRIKGEDKDYKCFTYGMIIYIVRVK